MLRGRIAFAVFLLLWLQTAFASGKPKKTVTKSQSLSERERALHALQRLTFGPRPGDVQKVLAMGLGNWIEQQLNPAKIPNPVLDSKLGQYRTVRMQPRELAQAFPTYQMIREAAEGKRGMPPDPLQYGLWEVLVDKYNEQQKNNAAAAQSAVDDPAAQKAAEDAKKDAATRLANMLLALPKANRMDALMKLPMDDRRTLVQYIPGDARN